MLYGGNNNWFAAYAYWYFKLYGHQDVKLLDGGRKKWELDSRELTDELPTREKTTYTAQEQDRSIRAFRDEAVAAIGVKNLVDVRSPDEYAGRLLAPAHLPQEQAQRAGHIPTAAQRAVEQGGQRRRHLQVRRGAAQALRRGRHRLDARTPSRCAASVSAPRYTWFVLKELLGQQNVKNYDGSWTEYGSLVGVPVALGDEPGDGLMCGATEGGLSLDGVNVAKEAMIQGQVTRDGEPVGNAYVRLLDRTGEFTAEVPTSATGHFRFFAGDGRVDAAHPGPEGGAGRQHGHRPRLGGRGRHRDLSDARTRASSPDCQGRGSRRPGIRPPSRDVIVPGGPDRHRR